MQTDKLVRSSAMFIIIIAIATILIVAKDFLIPIAWAFLFTFVLHPLCVRMESKGLSRTIATTLSVVLFIVICGALLYVLAYEATIILTSESLIYERIGNLITRIQNYSINSFGLDITSPESANSGSEKFKTIITTAASALGTVGQNLMVITLIPVYLFFMIQYRGLVRKFVIAHYSDDSRQKIRKIFEATQISVESYLIGTMLLTLVTAVMTYIVLLIFGIKYALFFSVFMAILNLIPYIGNLIAFVFILLYVYITKESLGTAALVGAILYLSNTIQENMLRPVLVGNKMEMNAMVVFTSVIVGGMLWGVSGMVLFIPLLGMIKSFLINIEKLNAYAIFFEEPENPKKKK